MPRRPASPPPASSALALAGLWTTLSDLAAAGLLLGLALAAWAPPQDLPWTPLRLDQPTGLFTPMKFAAAARDPARCRQVLSQAGVRFAEAPDRRGGPCGVRDALRLRGGAPALSPPGPLATCALALGYVFWMRHTVEPLAAAELGQPILAVEHYGTYACRRIYHRPGGPMSEHAFADALDVAAFRTAGGARISVAADYRDPGPRGRFLRAAHDGACRWFRAVLGPDYNPAHRDHLHLDFGPYLACR